MDFPVGVIAQLVERRVRNGGVISVLLRINWWFFVFLCCKLSCSEPQIG